MTFGQHCWVGEGIARRFGLTGALGIFVAGVAYSRGLIDAVVFLQLACVGLGLIIAGVGAGVSYVAVSVVGDARARRSR